MMRFPFPFAPLELHPAPYRRWNDWSLLVMVRCGALEVKVFSYQVAPAWPRWWPYAGGLGHRCWMFRGFRGVVATWVGPKGESRCGRN